MTIKSSRDALDVENTHDKNVSNKNEDLAIVNGVHKDLSPSETPESIQGDSKPELVTVKEGYSLVAPKQKATVAKESQDDARLNGTLANEKNIGERANTSKQQQRTDGHVSGLLPLAVKNKERDSNAFQPKSATKQHDGENIVASAPSVNRKLKTTSVELSDIPLAFEQPEAGKDPKLIFFRSFSKRVGEKTGKTAVERTQVLPNNELSEKGGKTDIVNQSQSDTKSRDVEEDSPWVRQLPQGGEQDREEKTKRKEMKEIEEPNRDKKTNKARSRTNKSNSCRLWLSTKATV
ncbi:hypothetical protein OS493_011660 [Desmophyllum pertusum]|uniref:Uncharacterized protein n=1 Tax=Desmophyllum pertusum TaxID=174260 RepID=A0A9W9YQZ2_9CNID|nr:hypothetical protein OS493_011660 [Desmophyllum pertusum]